MYGVQQTRDTATYDMSGDDDASPAATPHDGPGGLQPQQRGRYTDATPMAANGILGSREGVVGRREWCSHSTSPHAVLCRESPSAAAQDCAK